MLPRIGSNVSNPGEVGLIVHNIMAKMVLLHGKVINYPKKNKGILNFKATCTYLARANNWSIICLQH